MHELNAHEHVQDMLKLVNQRVERIRQILVVNTKQTYSLPEDYEDYSVTSEYLSERELSQILDGFRDGGTVTDLYVGDRSFIRALVTCEMAPHSDSIDTVLYSTASSGTWHGRGSLIPAVCGAWNVGYCASDAYAMAAAGNKYYALRLAQGCGQNTGEVRLYLPGIGWCNNIRPSPGQRVIIKPAYEAASIGVDDSGVRWVDEELDGVVAERAARLRQPLVVQSFVSGYEIEVPVFGVPDPIAPAAFGVSASGQAHLGDRILTYHQVYHEEYGFYRLSDVDPSLDLELRASATRIFAELGLFGMGRIDYRVRPDGSWAVTDIGAFPHLTPELSNSLAFATLGLSYADMLKLVTAAGLVRLGYR